MFSKLSAVVRNYAENLSAQYGMVRAGQKKFYIPIV